MGRRTALIIVALVFLGLAASCCCCCSGTVPFLEDAWTPQPPRTPAPPQGGAPDTGEISVGDTVSGDYEEGTAEVWILTLVESATIDIDLTAEGDAWDPILEIRDADGMTIEINDDGGDGYNSRLNRLSLPGGTYEIHVQAYDGEGGYALSVQESGEVEYLEYGDTVLGEINEGGEAWWQFEGAAGDAVQISMVGLGGFDDTYLELYDSAGNWLASDDDGGEGFFALIAGYTLREDGEYSILASGFGSSAGQYELSLEAVEVEELSIGYGETRYGELTDSVRQQYWVFEGEEGDVVSISMEGMGAFDDTYLELYGPDNEWLISDDDSGEGFFASIMQFPLPETGIYRILARAYGGDIGEYALTLESGEGGRPGEVGEQTIAYGETGYGSITEVAPEQYWTFEGQAGDMVSISMEGMGGFGDTYLELYGPNGEWLAADDDSGDGLFAHIGGFVLPETGSYRILARAYGGETGDYALTLDTMEIVESTIAYGETRSGELTVDQPQAYWTFEGVAGDVVNISMVGSMGLNDTYLELYGPDGQLLAENDDGGEGLFALIGNVALGETGTYRIVARAFGSGLGAYDLTLVQVKENTIVYGQTLPGALTEAAPQEWWSFDGAAGELVSISMVGLGDLEDTCLELRDLDGTVLATDDDGGKGDFARIDGYALPISGTYRIVASGYCDTPVPAYDIGLPPEPPAVGGLGSYRLSLRQVEVGNIAYGQTVNGELTEEALVDYWRFEGTAGNVIDLSLLGVGDLDPYLALYAPDGALLVADDDSGEGYAALVEGVILPETGGYRVAVRSFDDQPGAYRLNLRRVAVTEQPLAYGDAVTATLSLEDPVGYFRFDGEEDDEVVISLVGLEDFTDTVLELYGPGGDLLARDDDSGEGYFALIETALPENGVYRIVAQGYSGQLGQYVLELETRP